MRMAWQIGAGILASAVLLVVLLLGVARFSTLPLTLVADFAAARVAALVPGVRVAVFQPALTWSPQHGMFAVTADIIDVTDPDGAQTRLEGAFLAFSGDALRAQGMLAVAEITVQKMQLTPSQKQGLPATLGVLVPGTHGERNRDGLAYLSSIAVRDIVVGDPVPGQPSQFLLLREDERFKLTANLVYPSDGAVSSIVMSASLRPGQKGHADIELEQVNPQDIARFSTLLAPLQRVSLPATGTLGLAFDGQGRPLRGAVNIAVAPGEVALGETGLDVAEIVLALEADFVARRMTLTDARFNLGGVAGQLNGTADYSLSASGHLKDIALDLDGSGFQIDRPELFSRKLALTQIKALLQYDMATADLNVERLTGQHNYGQIDVSGRIGLAGSQPHIDIAANFGAMSRAGLQALWPLPIAPKIRAWADANVLGGRVAGAGLVLDVGLDELTKRKPGTPMREAAMRFDLTLADVGLRFLKEMPPLQDSRIALSLRGTSLQADGTGGRLMLPDAEGKTQPLTVKKLSFLMPDYRDRQTVSEISVQAEGVTRDVIRMVGRPPINATRTVDFDFDRIGGRAAFDVALALPILAKPENRKVTFNVDAVSRDFSIRDKLGPFQLSGIHADLNLTNAGMQAIGRARANGAELGFAWQQPFGNDTAADARLAVHGPVTPEQAAALGFAWVGQRFTGLIDANILVKGPVNKPEAFHIEAGLTRAAFSPRPLSYLKPVDEPAHLSARVTNNADGQMQGVDVQLRVDGKTEADVQLGFDGPALTKLEMKPVSLGRDKNLQAQLQMDGPRRYLTMKADAFDVVHLFRTFNTDIKTESDDNDDFLPFLGPDAIVEGQIAQVVGANRAELNGVKIRLIREKTLHEKLSLEGVFKSGAPLIVSLDRATATSRDFAVQTENTGELLRLFDWQREVYGGVLLIQGTLVDPTPGTKAKRDLGGRVTMVGFRARNVPVLASMFSLASLSGIADTLSGEGIKFRKLQSNFLLRGTRLNIDDGLVHGPAVGFTVQGDYDFGRGDIDVGGTLVPAYSINSFFGKIPLIGRILGGRRGEGVVGIGYRITGSGGKASALVNPLSVLTPGVFRRIFELGIGLPDAIDERIPDFPQKDFDFPEDDLVQ